MPDGTRPTVRKNAPRALRLALEPRMMFDAAAAATVATVSKAAAADTADTHHDAVATQALLDAAAKAAAATATDTAKTSTTNTTGATDTKDAGKTSAETVQAAATTSTATTPAAATTNSSVHEVVIVDTSVADYQTLIAGMDPSVPVILLGPGQRTIHGIAEALSQYSNLDQVVLVSEGGDGGIILGGNKVVTDADLASRATDLAAIGASLKTGGDFVLLGCSIAEDATGQKFVDDFARYLGNDVDVAASTNRTGPAALGGDWVMEYTSGKPVDVVLPFTVAGMQGIDHCLGCVAVQYSGAVVKRATNNTIVDEVDIYKFHPDQYHRATNYHDSTGVSRNPYAYHNNLQNYFTIYNTSTTSGNRQAVAAFLYYSPSQNTSHPAAQFLIPAAGLWDYSSRVYYTSVDSFVNHLITNNLCGTPTQPTLDATKSPTLTSESQADTAAPTGAVGTLVSSLVNTTGIGNFTDSGSGTPGLALTGLNTTNGSWWYTTDGGSNWHAVGTVSSTSALLLSADSNTRLYFQVTNSSFSGTISDAITFRAWDGFVGTNGVNSDPTDYITNNVAFSTATDTASLTIAGAPPTVGATHTSTANDNATATPFSSVTFVDGTNGATSYHVDITLDAANGVLSGTGLTHTDGTHYTLTASTASALQTALRTLVFTPTKDQVAVGQTKATTFTLTPGDDVYSGSVTADSTSVITVTSINDAPAFVQAGTANLTVAHNSTSIDLTSYLHVSDTDISQTETWTVSSAAGHGTVTLTSATASSGSSDITPGGTLTYVPTSGYIGSDSFTIQVSDGTSTVTRTFSVTVTGPVISGTHTSTANDTGTATPFSSVTFTDNNSGATSYSVAITLSANNGTLSQSSGTGLTSTDSTHYTLTASTASALQTALQALVFTPTANQVAAGSTQQTTFTLTPNDDLGVAGTADSTSVITVTSINDAPVLDASKSPTLTAEANTTTAAPSGAVGTLVSSLVASGTGVANVTDADASAQVGMAITATDTAHGVWWYSTDGGGTWTNVNAGTTVSGTASLLLKADANTRLYFQVTDTSYTGTAAITFRAWDQTSGTAGTKVSTTTNSGTTPYSSATDTASITITGPNAAPVINDLNGDSVTWVDASTAIRLDSGTAVSVSDTENDAATWNNASLVVERVKSGSLDGSATDVFSFDSSVTSTGTMTQGSNGNGTVTVNGKTFNWVYVTSSGQLTIDFGSAGANATDVAAVMHAIQYSNATPYGNATIRFALSDGSGNTTNADVTVASSTIYVTTTSDQSSGSASDGFSLREALNQSAAQSTADTIIFADGVNGTITMASGVTLGAGDTLKYAPGTGSSLSIAVTSGGLTLGGGATVQVGADSSVLISADLAGTGSSLTKTGAGTLTLSGTNTYTGATAVSGGILALGSLGQTSGLTLDGGTLASTAAFSSSTAITINAGGGTFDFTGGSMTLGGVISGTGALDAKSGATGKAFKLTGSNTFSGGITLDGGILDISNTNALGTGTLTFNSGKIRSTTAAYTVANNLVINSDLLMAGSYSMTFSGTVDLGGGTRTINDQLGAGLDLTFSGVVQNGSLDVASQVNNNTYASVILTGTSNTYTDVTVTSGTLNIAGAGSLGSGSVTLAGGTLLINGAATIASNIAVTASSTLQVASGNAATLSGVISGSTGTLTLTTGTGTNDGLTLSGANTYTGAISISAGTVTASGGSAIADTSAVTVASGATLALAASETIGSLSGAGTVSLGSFNTLTAGDDNTDTSFSGAITGTGGLTKTGTGTLTLSGTSTYTGATTISAGEIMVSGGSAIADSSAVTVASGATLQLEASNETVGSLAGAGTVTLNGGTLTTGGNNTSTTFSGVLQDGGIDGGLTKAGTGTFTLSGANTYTGTTTISAGKLEAASSGALGSSTGGTTIASAGTLLIDDGVTIADAVSTAGNGSLTLNTSTGSATVSGNVTLTADARVNVNGTGTLTLGGTVGGAYTLYKNVGTGTLVLSNSNGAGATNLNIATGTLSITDNTNLTAGTLTLNGGALAVTGSAVTVSKAITLGSGGGTIRNANDVTLSGALSSTGGLIKTGAGKLTLTTGTNTYTGSTTISAGTLAVAGLGSTSSLIFNGGTLLSTGAFTSSTAITVNAAGGTVDSTGLLSLSGAVTGTGALTAKSTAGNGVLKLLGNNTFSGGVTLTSGILDISSNTALGTGTLTINGGKIRSTTNLTYNLANNLVLNTDLLMAGTYALAFSGTVDLGGATRTINDQLGSGNDLTFSGVVSNGSLNVASQVNGGTYASVILSNTGNTYTNATVTSGTLSIAGAGSLGSGSVTLAGGTLLVNGAATIAKNIAVTASSTLQVASGNAATLSGNITGSNSTLTLTTGTGANDGLTLSGANSYSGALSISAGKVTASGGSAIADTSAVTVASGATLALAASETIGSLAGAGTVSLGSFNTLTAGGDNTSTTFSGAITGTGGLTKTGTGTLTLSGANTYTGATTISAGQITVSGGSAISDSSAVSVASGATLLVSASETVGSLSGAGTVTLNGATLTAGGDNTSTTFSGVIQNGASAGALSKAGSGTFTLSGANTYTGVTTISAGTLEAASSGALGSSTGATTVVSGASLKVDDGVTIADALTIAGSGISSSGAINLSSGSATLSGNVTLSAASSIYVADTATLTLGGALAGAFTLTRNFGNGAVVLTANNSTGSTNLNIQVGTLSITDQTNLTTGTLTLNMGNTGVGGLLVTGTNVTISKNITLGASGGIISNANALTLTGNITGGVSSNLSRVISLTKVGAGKLTLSGTNTYTSSTSALGATMVSAGTLSVTNATNLGSTTIKGAVILNGGALEVTGSSVTLANNILLNADSAITVDNSAILSGVISGARNLTLNGVGTLTLSGTNTYTGTTTVIDGTLSIAAATNLGSGALTLNGGTLTVTGSSVSLSQAVALGSNGGTVSTVNALTLSGNITGSGDLVLNGGGTFTLSGTNTYTGDTVVRDSALSIAAATNLGGSALTLNGGTLTVTGSSVSLAQNINLSVNNGTINTDNSLTLSGVVGGFGDLLTGGAGSVTLSGSSGAYTQTAHAVSGTLVLTGALGGDVNVQDGATLGGTGTVGGNLVVYGGGTLAPGVSGVNNGIGTLTVTGNVNLGGALQIQIAGATSNNDVLSVGGNVVLNDGAGNTGTLTLSTVGGYALALGDSFTVVNNTGSGTTDTTAFGNLDSDGRADVSGGGKALITNSGGTGDDIVASVLNAAPTLTTTPATSPNFTEGGSAVSLFSGTTISTVEAGQSIHALTLTVGGVVDGTSEVLTVDGSAVTLTNGTAVTTSANHYAVSVSVSGTTATVTITKNGDFSATDAQTLVNGLTYQNDSQVPTAGTGRTVTLTSIQDNGGTANGGTDATTLTASTTVTVTPVNNSPTLPATGATSTIPATPLNAASDAVSVSSVLTDAGYVDPDAHGHSGIAVTGLTGSGTWQYSTDGGTNWIDVGTVSTTGALLLDSTAKLRYVPNGATVETATVTFKAWDETTGTATSGATRQTADTTTSGAATAFSGNNGTLSVTAQGATATAGGTSGYTDGGGAGVIDSGITLADSASTTLTSATVTIGSVVAGDVLAFVNQNGITGSYDATTGVLTLTGTASIADYQAALRSVTFNSTSQDPTLGDTRTSRTISWSVNDGIAPSAPVTSTITVTGINDAPTLTTTPATSPVFTEGGSAVALFSGTTISTVEAGQKIDSLTLTIGGLANGASEILTVDGQDVTLTNGTTVTTTANGYSVGVSVTSGTATVSITKSSGVTAAAAQTLVDGLTYKNTSGDPTTGTGRIVTLTSIQDNGGTAGGGHDTTTLTASTTVTLHPVNQAPTLTTTPATSPGFTEGGSAVSLFSGTTVSTSEASQSVHALTLTVGGVTNGTSEVLTVDGSAVTLTSGTAVTTSANGYAVSVSVSGTTATVTITKNGDFSATDAQTLVNGLTYQNDSQDPTAGTGRTVTLTSIQDNGGTANGGTDTTTLTASTTVTITPVNNSPTLPATGATSTIPATPLNAASDAVSVSSVLTDAGYVDPDSHGHSGIAVTGLTGSGTWQYSTDGGTNWIDVGTVSTTGALLLDSTAKLRYVPNGATVETATVTFKAWDETTGTATSGATRQTADTTTSGAATAFSGNNGTLSVTAQGATATAGGTSGYTDGGGAGVIDSGITLADSASTTLTSATVTIGSVVAGDVLAFVNQNGITGSYDATTGVLTLTGTASVADYQAALRSVTFNSTSQDPTLGDTRTSRTISWSVNDGIAPSAPVTSTVTITAVNDAPTLTVPGAQTITDTLAHGLNVSVADPDAWTGTETVTVSAGKGNLAVTASGGASVSGTGTGSLTIAGTLADVNATLASLTYTTTATGSDSDTVTVTVNDGGNTGTGGPLSDSKTIAVTLTGNAAPTISVAATQSFTDTNSHAITGVGVSDSLAGGTVTATVSDLHGNLGFTAAGSASVSGTGTGSVTITGTLADVNATLGTLTYATTATATGTDTITVTVNDGGSSLIGGAKSATQTIAVTLTGNDVPSLALAGAQSYVDQAGHAITGVAITDTLPGSTVTATVSDLHGNLSFTAAGAATVTGGGTGSVTITGSLADVNATLATLTYATTLSTAGSDTITVAVNDGGTARIGGAKSTSGTIAVAIATNDTPVLSVAGAQSYTDTNAHAISGVSISDTYNGTVTATVSDLRGNLGFTAAGAASVTGAGTGSVTITGSLADVNATLATLTYATTATTTGTDTITVTVNDGGGSLIGGAKAAAQTIAINLTGNDTPVLSVAGTQSYNDTTVHAITGVSVSDTLTGNTVTAALIATQGTITVSAAGSATVSGSGSGVVSITGSLADVNATLATLGYATTATTTGTDTLTIAVSDGGSARIGGAKSTSQTIAINLTGNDTPVLSVAGAQSYTDTNAHAITGVSISDSLTGTVVTATVSATQGNVAVTASGGATLAGNGTGSLTITGTLADVNATLASLTYATTATTTGSDTITVSANDGGTSRIGGAKSTTQTIAVSLTGNDTPVVTVPSAQSYNDTNAHAITGISVSDTLSGNAITVALLAGKGNVTVTATGGATVSGNGSGVVSVSGSVADVNATLATLTYATIATGTDSDTITVAVSDGGTSRIGGVKSAVRTVAISLTGNDTPVLTLPAGKNISATGSQAITGISISDTLNGGAVSVTVRDGFGGQLVMAASGSATLSGNGTGAVIVTGSVADVNATLASLSLTPATTGNDIITVTVNDGGTTRVGGAKTTTGTVGVTINPVVVPQPATQTTTTTTTTTSTPVTTTTSSLIVTPTVAATSTATTTVSLTQTVGTGNAGVSGTSSAGLSGNSVISTSAAAATTSTTTTSTVTSLTTDTTTSNRTTTTGTASTTTGTTTSTGTTSTGTTTGTAATVTTSTATSSSTTVISASTGVVSITSASSGTTTLTLATPVSNQVLATGQQTTFQLPQGTFQSSDPQVSLEARQSNGQPLPAWLTFNPATGTFTGQPPAGESGTIAITVTARDSNGNVAEAKFNMAVGQDQQTGTGASGGGQAPGNRTPQQHAANDPATAVPSDLEPIQLAAYTGQGGTADDLAAKTANGPGRTPAGKLSLTAQLQAAAQAQKVSSLHAGGFGTGTFGGATHHGIVDDAVSLLASLLDVFGGDAPRHAPAHPSVHASTTTTTA
ncbi:autotransporter-associated beta strand repeat-containing protein [Nitrospirillum pindoramense]|uniref:Autotransporter-like protein n=1 Tax=Nitrospirillum amazonense TaxID=28077 RepID=A0A560GTD3_9PROT|nr:autotransporter-associated beta strand repeat-containing protein [Nitrospirillum amazonense]TWB37238.1 autotransporter-like protein [Nitrospirillum amazonense]